MSSSLTDNEWRILIERIEDKKCTPFLGAGACYGVLPLGADIARAWAKEYDFPLEDSSNLVSVAQFVALTRDPMVPKDKLVRMFAEIKKTPDFTDPNEPHWALAGLRLPIYITTNYDNFMLQALIGREWDARQELCRWNNSIQNYPSSFDGDYVPTVAKPVVFHLHGYNPISESLVVTEDDYLDFLVNISRNEELLPALIKKAFTSTSLLFVGYRIADWNFRVLLRGLVGFMEASVRRTHFAVMPPPAASEEQQEKVKDYLSNYYDNNAVKVYWGTAREFVTELQQRMGSAKTA